MSLKRDGNINNSRKTKLYEGAIKHWGEALQILMAIEEMAELTKELVKFFRGKWTSEKMAEEIADVQIMCEQLGFLFDSKRIDAKKKEKLIRLEKMLKEQGGDL